MLVELKITNIKHEYEDTKASDQYISIFKPHNYVHSMTDQSGA